MLLLMWIAFLLAVASPSSENRRPYFINLFDGKSLCTAWLTSCDDVAQKTRFICSGADSHDTKTVYFYKSCSRTLTSVSDDHGQDNMYTFYVETSEKVCSVKIQDCGRPVVSKVHLDCHIGELAKNVFSCITSRNSTESEFYEKNHRAIEARRLRISPRFKQNVLNEEEP